MTKGKGDHYATIEGTKKTARVRRYTAREGR
jgi:hypothetical protein